MLVITELKNRNDDKLTQLVYSRFGSNYGRVTRRTPSPHAEHYILEKEGIKKHLKIVTKKYLNTNEASEIDLLNSVSSEYVIKLEECGEFDNERMYLLFSHINGETLDKLKNKITWDDSEIRKLGLDIVNGFKDLDKAGIVHRDIKPKNIIRNEETGKYIILDLGIGYFMDMLDKNKVNIVPGSGSKFYSAPEQFRVVLNDPYCITTMTDEFSLGVILYELSTHIHPFITDQSSKKQNYANAINSIVPENIEEHTNLLSLKTIRTINKMMAIEPSERFLNLDNLAINFGDNTQLPKLNKSKIYLKIPRENKADFVNFLSDNAKDVDGVIFNCSTDTLEISKTIRKMGIEILLDPRTCTLTQENKNRDKSGSKVVKCLNLPVYSNYSIFDLINIKDNLLEGAYYYSKTVSSDKLILPYFYINDIKDPFFKFTKQLWSEASNFYKKKNLKVNKIYGGIIIPYSTIINQKSRSVFLSQIMSKSSLNGVFVILENKPNNTINVTTTTDENYLEGVKHIVDFFESMFDDVIFYRTDISILPFLKTSSFATGWAKGARHFSFNGTGRRPESYKMRYFAQKLFTFIEESTLIQTIIATTNDKSSLMCDCKYCKQNNPLATNYKPDELKERSHFYKKILELNSKVSSLRTMQEKNNFYNLYLEEAEKKGEEIKIKSSGVIGRETIPSYKTLISLINDR